MRRAAVYPIAPRARTRPVRRPHAVTAATLAVAAVAAWGWHKAEGRRGPSVATRVAADARPAGVDPERERRARAFHWMAAKAGARCDEITTIVRQAADSWVVTCDLQSVYEMGLDAGGEPARLRRLR